MLWLCVWLVSGFSLGASEKDEARALLAAYRAVPDDVEKRFALVESLLALEGSYGEVFFRLLGTQWKEDRSAYLQAFKAQISRFGFAGGGLCFDQAFDCLGTGGVRFDIGHNESWLVRQDRSVLQRYIRMGGHCGYSQSQGGWFQKI